MAKHFATLENLATFGMGSFDASKCLIYLVHHRAMSSRATDGGGGGHKGVKPSTEYPACFALSSLQVKPRECRSPSNEIAGPPFSVP